MAPKPHRLAAFGEAILSSSNFVLTLALVAIPSVRQRFAEAGFAPADISVLVSKIPIPTIGGYGATVEDVRAGYEELLSAAAAVDLFGTKQAQQAADGLRVAWRPFLQMAFGIPKPWAMSRTNKKFEEAVAALNAARAGFIAAVQREL